VRGDSGGGEVGGELGGGASSCFGVTDAGLVLSLVQRGAAFSLSTRGLLGADAPALSRSVAVDEHCSADNPGDSLQLPLRRDGFGFSSARGLLGVDAPALSRSVAVDEHCSADSPGDRLQLPLRRDDVGCALVALPLRPDGFAQKARSIVTLRPELRKFGLAAYRARLPS